MKEPEPYRDADIWFSETEEEEDPGISWATWESRLVLHLSHDKYWLPLILAMINGYKWLIGGFKDVHQAAGDLWNQALIC
jgi:hypothetical protein